MSDKRLQLILELKDKALAPLRSIQAGSQDAAQALAATRAQLKQLNGQQAALDRFEKSTASMRESSNQLKVLRQNLQMLQTTGQGNTAQAKKLQTEVEKQTAKFKDQQTKVLELRTSLTRLGITNASQAQQRLGADIATTNAKIDAQKNALKRLGEQHKRVEALKAQHGKAMVHAGMAAGAGVAMVAAGRAMTRPVQATLGEYSVQENASTQLSASMMLADGSVSKEFKALDQLAKRLGDRLPGTTADFLELMAVLKQQGLGDSTILGGTGEAAALLGVQLRMNSPAAGEFAAKMQDATRTAEKDMMGLMDTIQRSYYMGVDSGNMLQGFSKMSPVMSILNKEGLEFSNMMAPLLVMMDQTGMAGESAGNAIRKVFQGGLNTKKLEKANEMLKSSKAGFQLKFTDKSGAFLGMDNVFSQLQKLKGLGNNAVLRTGVMQALFGDDSETLQVLNTMMDKGKSGYQEVADKMAAQASLQQRVDQQLGTLTNVMEATQGGFTNVMASIGETVQGDAKSVINWMGDVTSTIGAWVKEHPVLTANIVRTLAVLAALTAGLGLLMVPLALMYGKIMLVRFAFGMLNVKLPSLLAGVRGLAGAAGRFLPLIARAAPMLLRVLGPIGLVASAGWAIYSNWDAISSKTKALWQDLGNWWGGFSDRLASNWSTMWSAVASTASSAMTALVDGVRGFLSGGVDTWSATLANFSPFGLLWNAITTALDALGIQVPEKFRNFGSFIVDGLIGGIGSKLSALKETVLGMAGMVQDLFTGEMKIRSPSRVFMEYGGFISQGAALGIQNGQAGVHAAVLALAGAAAVGAPAFAADGGLADPVRIDRRPALAAPGASRPAPVLQGDTIAIHVHAAPGMDAVALAQAVAAELQRREYAKAARLQGSFNDFG